MVATYGKLSALNRFRGKVALVKNRKRIVTIDLFTWYYLCCKLCNRPAVRSVPVVGQIINVKDAALHHIATKGVIYCYGKSLIRYEITVPEFKAFVSAQMDGLFPGSSFQSTGPLTSIRSLKAVNVYYNGDLLFSTSYVVWTYICHAILSL